MAFPKKISKFFKVLNLIIVILYLLACLVPYVNPGTYWFVALLGLIFPVLFLGIALFFIAGLLVRSGWSILSLLAIILSWQQLSAVFSRHAPQAFAQTKSVNNLRIFQWNVSSWDELNKEEKGGSSYRPLMFQQVKNSGADVLCFEEFLETRNTAIFAPTIVTLQKLGYPFYYYVPTHSSENNKAELGMIIFSKSKIVNTGIYDFEDPNSVQQLIYADIIFGQQLIRVFAIHLQSVHFGKEEYTSLNELRHSDKSGLKDSRTIIGKLKRGYNARSVQAKIVDSIVRKSPYPMLLCGDFNDVPNSFTYFTVKGNMQDAFLQKGAGIGRTFRFISPTLRIDYIFADKKFSVNQYTRLTVPYSDHYGIIADVSLIK